MLRTMHLDSVHGDGELCRCIDDLLLVHARFELHQEMQPGGDAVDTESWRMLAQGPDQNIATAPIDQARPSQMAVELSPLEKVGVSELVQGGRAHVFPALKLGDLRDELPRQHKPTKT